MKRQQVTISPMRLRAHRVANPAEERIESLARWSYVASGAAHLGAGALLIAGARLEAPGGFGEAALPALLPPLSAGLALATVALGLLGSSVWPFLRFWFDPERDAGDRTGPVLRGLWGLAGLVHVLLAVEAVAFLSAASGMEPTTPSAALVSDPRGIWVAGVLAAALLAVGSHEMREGWRGGFKKRIRLHELSAGPRRWAIRLGRAALVGRGALFAAVAATWMHQWLLAGQEGGAPLAPWLDPAYQAPGVLAFAGAVLLLYGGFQLVNARFRHIG